MMQIIGMDEIEKRYQPGIGRHWFDADSKRFFRCRLADHGYESACGDVFFVSSEQNQSISGGYSYPRLYSVRVLKGPGEIDTVGEFQAYDTRGKAERAAKRFATLADLAA